MRRLTRSTPLLLILTLVSCASTSELLRRSEVAVGAGDSRQGYDWARRALDREPQNARARELMASSAGSILEERKAHIREVAALDTLGAARFSLELDGFRGELARYGVARAPDPGFSQLESQVRGAAAAFYHGRGAERLRARRPKRATSDFDEALRFSPGDRDVATMRRRALDEAVQRVAILPFDDEVAIPWLSAQLAADLDAAMAYQLDPKRFPFTRLVRLDQVYQRLAVAQMGDLPRDAALRLGRALGARRIVTGRIHGLRSSTNTDAYHQTIFRRVTDRDADGRARVRYVEHPFEAVSREREVRIALDFDVRETDEGRRLAHGSHERTVVAHTIYTSFTPEGSCEDYCLVPPGLEDAHRARSAEKEWRAAFGSWTLPALLERARRDAGRTRYLPAHRPEFAAVGTSTPVFLDDLPPVEELALIALSDAWMPLLATLRDLDPRDDADILTGRDGD